MTKTEVTTPDLEALAVCARIAELQREIEKIPCTLHPDRPGPLMVMQPLLCEIETLTAKLARLPCTTPAARGARAEVLRARFADLAALSPQALNPTAALTYAVAGDLLDMTA